MTPLLAQAPPEEPGGQVSRRRDAALASGATTSENTSADEYADGTAFYRFSALLGLTGAVLFAVAIVAYNVAGVFTRNVLGLLLVAGVLGVLYAIPRLDQIGAWFRTRAARQGGNVTLASVAFIGLLVVGNWFANRHSPQWDLTATRRYTLSDQSLKVVNSLDRDVKITAFFPSRQEAAFTRGTRDLLRQYARRSPRLTLEFIDPDINPGAARQFDIKSYPVTIFQAGDRKEETAGVTEQDFTSALLKVTRTEKKKVYFLQGHQERDTDSAQPNGYNAAAEGLRRENYLVEKLSLLSTQTVPEDAAVLVFAGPRAPLLEPELKSVEDYLERGGHILLLVEPRQDSGLSALLDRWYISLGNNIVVDPGRNYSGDPLTPAPEPQAGHRITTTLPTLLLPGSRSVAIKPGAGSDFAIAPLLRTTDRSWGEANIGGPYRPDPPEDVLGPLTVAVAVNKTDPVQSITPGAAPAPAPTAVPGEKQPRGRMVVVGNAEFATNTYFNQVLGNRDFFINSVNWLAEDEDLISIRAEPQDSAPIVLTNQSQVLVFYASVVFIPLSVLLLGAAIWWQRR